MSEEMCKETCIGATKKESDLKRLENYINKLEKRAFLLRDNTQAIRSSLMGSKPEPECIGKEKCVEENRITVLIDQVIDINETFNKTGIILEEIQEVVE